MKKTVIIILAILPIFLVITISFAGRILSLYQHISVEKVMFVDENTKEYEKGFVFVINIGEEKQTFVRVLPDLASNKKVTYTSDNEEVCSVNSEGKVKGISFGTATISVKTEEGSKKAMLFVNVTQDRVSGITLSHSQIELVVGSEIPLKIDIEPASATNKNVEYYSSDLTVADVDANGRVRALKEGQAIITVRTKDGGYTASCRVICKAGVPAISFNLPENENIIKIGDGYEIKLKEINLLNYLEIDEKKIKIESVILEIQFGNNVTLSNGVLTIEEGKARIVTIVAYVGDKENPTYQTTIMLKIPEEEVI